MIRVSSKGVEHSTSSGRSLMTRYSGSSCGTFIDFLPYGNEFLAVTSKGIYYSTSGGSRGYRVTLARCVASSAALLMAEKNSLRTQAKDCSIRQIVIEVGTNEVKIIIHNEMRD